MIRLQVRAGAGQASAPLITDIRDFQLVQTGSGVFAVSSTGRNGGLVSYRLEQGGAAVVHDTQNFSAAIAGSLNDNLFWFTSGGQDVLLVGDVPGAGALGYTFGQNGRFGSSVQLDGLSAGGAGVSALYDSGAGFVFIAGAGGDAFGCYTGDGSGGFDFAAQIEDSTTTYGRDVAAIRGGMINGQQIVIVASGAEAGVTSYQLNPDSGALSVLGSMGAAQGLGIMGNIAGLEVVTAYGSSYVIIASAATNGEAGALSVLEVLPSGALRATDHLLDNRDTRFGQVQSLAVVEADGRIYVLAGGGDDGISLLVLLPNGRLQHLDSLADTEALTLANVSAIVAVQVGSELQVLVAGQGDSGVTQLVFSLEDQGATMKSAATGGVLVGGDDDDILVGGAGADTLNGGSGDDILVADGGREVLIGGAGADTFVLHWDDTFDRIVDFEIGKDSLDLSDFPMFYDPALLDIQTTSTGAVMRWKGSETEVLRAGGGGLSAGHIRAAILAGPDRPPLILSEEEPVIEEGLTLRGGSGGDVLLGKAGDDLIIGQGGNDTLNGGGGNDTLRGGDQDDLIFGMKGDDVSYGGNGRDLAWMGAGDDVFYDIAQGGAFGRDTVWGEAGNDTIMGRDGDDAFHGQDGADLVFGGFGADLLSGGHGNDNLMGEGGNDTIWGGTGRDTLRGGNQDDRLYGEDGDDVLYGGNGRDTVWMGAGDDVFYDSAQHNEYGHDTVYGGPGKDTIWGGGGNDLAHGQDGNDLLAGGLGNDSLFGGNGNDTLRGGDGHDTMAGGTGRDIAYMGNGNDRWFDHAQSGGGHDYVDGGAGNDTLQGKGGDDTLVGGAGADVFIFAAAIDDDVIRDYEVGVDSLQFTSTLWAGDLSQSALLARALVVAGDVLFTFENGDTLRLDGVTTLAGLLDDIGLI